MIQLLLDSSDTELNVAIANENGILYSYSEYAWQRQSEYMIPEIEKALEICKITMKDIRQVIVGIGPGSYTGVRIPLTIAKTLNCVLGVSLIGCSSLAIMGTTHEKYIALMNARSKRSYIGIYDHGKTIVQDQIIENENLESFIKPYLDDGFVLRGNLEYLGKENTLNKRVIDGLYSYGKSLKPTENPKGLCPVYLKENYDCH